MPDQGNQNQPSTGPVPVTLGGNQRANQYAPGQDNTFNTMPSVITKPPSSGGSGFPKVIGAVLGLLFLVGAVTAGVLLVQQNQDINEGASDAQCYNVDTNACTFAQNPSHCWRATTNNACRRLDGTVDGTLEIFSGFGQFDGQVCYTCDANSLDNGTRKCSPGTLVETNPACGGGGDPNPPQPPGDPQPPQATVPPKVVCGESCTQDSDCAPSTTYSVNVACRAGKCVNLDCQERGGQTENGSLCRCFGVSHKCGEPCSAAIGLCDAGLSCTYLAQSQCSSSTRWPVCVPTGTQGGRGPLTGVPQYQSASFERRQCGAGTGDPNNNYVYHPAFASGMTNNQVLELICNPGTSSPTGQCLNVKIYDTNWVEITSAARSALKPGAVIRVAVVGSTTAGDLDQARFTFNGSLRAPVTQKKPGTQEFYDEITIPAGATNISIKGEVHHSTLGWF